MGYSEELDLIGNMKQLSKEVEHSLELLNEVKPSIQDIMDLKDQFQNLSDKTLGVINKYESSLGEESKRLNDLYISARSQFKQVTDDVEALVNLEVNFEDIKSKIMECLDLHATLMDFLAGSTIFMDDSHMVPLEEQKPYKQYLRIISVEER